jgi:hypothetical protein
MDTVHVVLCIFHTCLCQKRIWIRKRIRSQIQIENNFGSDSKHCLFPAFALFHKNVEKKNRTFADLSYYQKYRNFTVSVKLQKLFVIVVKVVPKPKTLFTNTKTYFDFDNTFVLYCNDEDSKKKRYIRV